MDTSLTTSIVDTNSLVLRASDLRNKERRAAHIPLTYNLASRTNHYEHNNHYISAYSHAHSLTRLPITPLPSFHLSPLVKIHGFVCVDFLFRQRFL